MSCRHQLISQSLNECMDISDFLKAARLKQLELVVNTSHCKVPDFNPWDEEIIPLIKAAEPLEDCLKTNYNWSRMDRDVIPASYYII